MWKDGRGRGCEMMGRGGGVEGWEGEGVWKDGSWRVCVEGWEGRVCGRMGGGGQRCLELNNL